MKSIQALREKRSNLAKELRSHYEGLDGKQWDAEADAKYNDLTSQIEALDKEIERLQKIIDIEASSVAATRQVAQAQGVSQDEAEHQNRLGKEALRAWLRGGISALTDEQRQALRDRQMRNAMSTGEGSEGGYLTRREFFPELQVALKSYGGMRRLANVITTDTGSPMDFPATDATAEEGEIVGENAAVSVGETVFSTLALLTQKYSSKSLALPFELLQDSQINIEGYIVELLGMRLGRIQNKHFTIGDGSGKPFGIVTGAAIGKTGLTGQTTTVTPDDLIDLIHSVDPAYRQNNPAFMMHDLTLAALKKLKDSENRPLWLPGIASSEPDTILGYRYEINQDMPVMGANAKSIAFGDFRKYMIRDVMGVSMFRMTDSKYTEKGQVGFLAFMRSGGRLIDVGGAVKCYRNSAT